MSHAVKPKLYKMVGIVMGKKTQAIKKSEVAIILREDKLVGSFGNFIAQNMRESGVSVIDSTEMHQMRSLKKIREKIKTYKAIIVFEENRLIPILFFCKSRNCKLILWEWNIVDKKTAEKINLLKFFCEIWTFDEKNAQQYGWKQNTQFYFCQENNLSEDVDRKTAFCSIADKGRYKNLYALRTLLSEYSVKCDFHVLRRDMDESKDILPDMVTSKEIRYDQYLKLLKKCDIVVDLLQDGQEGITMRTMEAVFFSKKLITNNKKILELPIFIRENIFVLGYDDNEMLSDFIERKTSCWPQKVIDYYEFNQWIERFLI